MKRFFALLLAALMLLSLCACDTTEDPGTTEPVVEPDCIAEASEELYADADAFQSNMTTEDILADVDGADDILC